MVKKCISFLVLVLCAVATLLAQNIVLPTDTVVTTTHSISINGQTVNYVAKCGMLPVWNDQGEMTASLFYTYYERILPKGQGNRPIIFSFNGGPGSASVWMHIAYTGPKVLNIDEEGYPIQPYGVKDNPYSILDVADIVFIDPVNTGYSRMVVQKDGKMPDKNLFFGVNADTKYLAAWMTDFTSRYNRWTSPKFIIGESYGGTRVMGLSLALQNNQWMYLNGVIMVSPADYKVLRQGGPVSSALNLPYYHATAWYHKKLDAGLQKRDLLEVLPDAEQFTLNQLIPALAKGSSLPETEKNALAEKMANLMGISKEVILQHHLDVPESFFWKELLRKEGNTIGRLDSRYLGIDRINAGVEPDYNAELTSWLHSFTPAINYYIREQLHFKTDARYNMFGPVNPWDFTNDNTRENLREAMAANPYLKVLIQSGYYDGACTYFAAKYTMWQTDPGGKMKNRFDFKGYRSGHMMYLRAEDLKKANDDLREFIKQALPNGKAAKYE